MRDTLLRGSPVSWVTLEMLVADDAIVETVAAPEIAVIPRNEARPGRGTVPVFQSTSFKGETYPVSDLA